MANTPDPTDYGTYVLWKWTGIDKGEDIDPAKVDFSPSELMIQHGGEPEGAIMTVSGSLDNVDYTGGLVDPFGNVVELTDGTGSVLRDHWLFIKPVLTLGGDDQDSDILLFARKRENTTPEESPA